MKICVVGVGYVGLPLAHAIAKAGHSVTGYDVNSKRIAELSAGIDRTNEVGTKGLREVDITFTDDPNMIKASKIIILAIPTPVDEQNTPDLSMVESATQTVGKHLKKGMIVVYESTVYPGTTEEICEPILEKESGLKAGKDFHLGYSPERVNPGDKTHTIDKIVKVVAGDDEETADILCSFYGSFVTAGIHRAPSIKVAEMAKAIENAQRDLNIAYVNEIALMCHKLGIRTSDVLKAAATKWNFLRFSPGLVGGHCISVDPYYLVEKAKMLGMETHVITAGRAVNDAMAEVVVKQIIGNLNVSPTETRILVLGLTFKENIPDTRNSRSKDVVCALEEAGCTVEAHDAQLADEEIERMGYSLGHLENAPYDAVILLVPHAEYCDEQKLIGITKPGGRVDDL